MVYQVVTKGGMFKYTQYTRMLVHLGQDPGNSRVALGTLLGRVTFRENVHIRSRELCECYTELQDDFYGRLEDF